MFTDGKLDIGNQHHFIGWMEIFVLSYYHINTPQKNDKEKKNEGICMQIKKKIIALRFFFLALFKLYCSYLNRYHPFKFKF